jgi:hypothetical protein
MGSILPYDAARQLAAFRDPVDLGVLIGCRVALSVITAEMTEQEDAAVIAAADDSTGRSAAQHEYTLSRLLSVCSNRQRSVSYEARIGGQRRRRWQMNAKTTAAVVAVAALLVGGLIGGVIGRETAPDESPTETPTVSPTETPIETPTEMSTETPTETSTETPTESATE